MISVISGDVCTQDPQSPVHEDIICTLVEKLNQMSELKGFRLVSSVILFNIFPDHIMDRSLTIFISFLTSSFTKNQCRYYIWWYKCIRWIKVLCMFPNTLGCCTIAVCWIDIALKWNIKSEEQNKWRQLVKWTKSFPYRRDFIASKWGMIGWLTIRSMQGLYDTWCKCRLENELLESCISNLCLW